LRAKADDGRAGDEDTRRVLRDEIRAGDEETRRVLRDEIRTRFGGVMTHARVLHEDQRAALAVIAEGLEALAQRRRDRG
jgi:hypothetical protein